MRGSGRTLIAAIRATCRCQRSSWRRGLSLSILAVTGRPLQRGLSRWCRRNSRTSYRARCGSCTGGVEFVPSAVDVGDGREVHAGRWPRPGTGAVGLALPVEVCDVAAERILRVELAGQPEDPHAVEGAGDALADRSGAARADPREAGPSAFVLDAEAVVLLTDLLPRHAGDTSRGP